MDDMHPRVADAEDDELWRDDQDRKRIASSSDAPER
jgi:hypothetical protein